MPTLGAVEFIAGTHGMKSIIVTEKHRVNDCIQ
jgi:hypothetical protein